MAILNGNNIYLTIDGISLGGKFTEVKMKPTSNGVPITHGATDWEQRNGGIKDITMNVIVAYDIATVGSTITHIAPGNIVPVEYGPENNVSGKPYHKQSFHIDDVGGPDVTVKKDMVVFEIAMSGADAPIKNMYAGDTF